MLELDRGLISFNAKNVLHVRTKMECFLKTNGEETFFAESENQDDRIERDGCRKEEEKKENSLAR